MSDQPVAACEICGASPVEKLLFPVAVHFKGSGFYSTDYGRGSRKGAKDSDTGHVVIRRQRQVRDACGEARREAQDVGDVAHA